MVGWVSVSHIPDFVAGDMNAVLAATRKPVLLCEPSFLLAGAKEAAGFRGLVIVPVSLKGERLHLPWDRSMI